jgi:hypothetical protein
MKKFEITKEDVIAVENKLFAAQLSSDVDVLDQLLHNDLIAITPAGQIVTKEMDLSSHKTKTMIIEDASTVIEEIRITGDIALSIVSMKAKGKMLGNPLEGNFKYFRVWKYFEDTLKVVGASIMQLP